MITRTDGFDGDGRPVAWLTRWDTDCAVEVTQHADRDALVLTVEDRFAGVMNTRRGDGLAVALRILGGDDA